MTRKELKEHCKKTVEQCEVWAIHRGEEPSGKVYEEHKAVLDILEQEPTSEMVHVETLRQVMWERDIAIEQLHELGYEFGQKIEPCDNAISREAVLKRIAQFSTEEGSSVRVQPLYSDVYNMPSVTQKSGKWIPVSERLPKKYTYTLWCASSGYVRSDYFNGEYWEDAKKLFYEVVAWMPLPKSYRTESEE